MKQRYGHTFSPIMIGKKVAKNRIEMAPTTHILATRDGQVTPELIGYYQSIARGGAGIVTIGESAVDFIHAGGHAFQLNLGTDAVHAGLCKMSEAIRKYGALASIEIGHVGNQVVHGGATPISASAFVSVREEIAAAREGRRRNAAVAMDQAMIDDVVQAFAAAAERCYKAGFDMVMIHGAHGHLISQFLSPLVNKRQDGYGGSLNNRARFAIEILEAVRKRVGNEIAIEYRISADEIVDGGMRPYDVLQFVKLIEDKIDLLHVSAGLLSNPDLVIHIEPPPYFERGCNVHYAEELKKHLSIPVATVGGIVDIEMVEEIVASGKADVVAMARALLADHDFPNKARTGRAEDIRPCTRCMTCMRLTGEHIHPVRCAVNPIVGRELEYRSVPPSARKKKVVVVGGGPAGMQAALTAAERGHEVVLFEKQAELGGNLRMASILPFKDDTRRYMEWMIGQTRKNPLISVRLDREADEEMVRAEAPDVVVVAVGSEPIIPEIPGATPDRVVWVGDVDAGRVPVGATVLVAGAGLIGLESALHLMRLGKDVIVVDMLPERQLLREGPRGSIYLLKKGGARLMTEVKLEAVSETGAIIVDRNWVRTEITCDTVVLSMGYRPRQPSIDPYGDVAQDIFVVGDARYPHDIKQAVHDGFHCVAEL